MAACLINANPFAGWRRMAFGALALVWMPICLLQASGAAPAARTAQDGRSAAVDIAIALSTDDESDEFAVEAAAYNRQPTHADEEGVLVETLVAQQAAPTAEEVAPSESLDDTQSTRRMLRPITQVTAD